MRSIEPTPSRESPSDFYPVDAERVLPDFKRVSTFRMVICVGGGRDWVVYYGPPSWTPETIATHGDKLPREAALMLFPNVRGRYLE